MARNKANKIHESKGDAILNFILGCILVFVIIIIGYPCIYIISSSFSSSKAIETGSVILWPVDFTLEAYKFVLNYKQVWVGLRNTVFYCFMCILFNMSFTILVAYPLSRRDFQGKKFYNTVMFVATRFSPGLIPIFILKCNLGLYDNIWAIIIDGLFAYQHILILRTAFQTSIPGDLFDAAMIDGANHFQCLFKIAIPLAKATLSVLILYILVANWNGYFTAMIYLTKAELYPLQLVLRPIMTAASAMGSMDVSAMTSVYQQQADQGLENVRYALILISTVPMLCAYAVVQKYFKGGVMMGSVKG